MHQSIKEKGINTPPLIKFIHYFQSNYYYHKMNPSRTDAKKDQFMGNMKEGAGNMLGNERMQSEGQTQQGAGNVQETAANVTGYVKGTMDQAAGAMKGAFNSLTGNTTGEAGNKVQQKKGEAQKDWNS